MEKRRIKTGDFEVCTYSEGQGEDVVLLIHGGPGCPSDYLFEGHAGLVDHGFRIVTWDQLGCGESDQPGDLALWSIPRFVAETKAVLDALDIGRAHVLGHSWGGILGFEFGCSHPGMLRSFVAANTTFDVPRTQRGFERKKQALGEETCVMMARHEAAGTATHPEYQAAVTLLMYRHMCRLPDWPAGLQHSMQNVGQSVFAHMFGPFFFNCTGTLRDYNSLDRLADFHIPTLVTTGEHDYIVPDLASTAKTLLPDAEMAMFRNCGHMPFYDDAPAYFDRLVPFLRKH